MSKNRRFFHIGILLLALEKVVQHLLSAAFFSVDIPGIGRPEIGPNFQLSATTMVVLNGIVCILFALGFWGRLRGREWHLPLLVGLSFFDILAEFVFHGFFFITVSVIAATALLILIKIDSDRSRNDPVSSASSR
jgi:hypothetical protein